MRRRRKPPPRWFKLTIWLGVAAAAASPFMFMAGE